MVEILDLYTFCQLGKTGQSAWELHKVTAQILPSLYHPVDPQELTENLGPPLLQVICGY